MCCWLLDSPEPLVMGCAVVVVGRGVVVVTVVGRGVVLVVVVVAVVVSGSPSAEAVTVTKQDLKNICWI